MLVRGFSSCDEDLLSSCRGGSQAAWSALVHKYRNLVYSVPLSYQLPPEEAAEVFQGVWLDLHRSLAQLRHPASLRSWLVTAASRRSLHRKKRWKRDLRSALPILPELPDRTPGIERRIDDARRTRQLSEAIGLLPARSRKLIDMLFFQHPPTPYREVARALGVAESSIGFLRSRCIAKLRKAVLGSK